MHLSGTNDRERTANLAMNLLIEWVAVSTGSMAHLFTSVLLNLSVLDQNSDLTQAPLG